ncbi:MlaD family protein, partial [Francisella tularensis subsp. holarctica]|uniref:MlaD family protein n=1 Tax=Francisella tularensis TaxID=263 RepID=UPI0023819FA0
NTQEYTITADFKNVGSLRTNASVTIAGVEIGRVTKIALEKSYNGFMDVVTMAINSDKKIPANYYDSIAMSGIMVDNYVALSHT